jgi:NADPH-dependent ferric siderophore reductase
MFDDPGGSFAGHAREVAPDSRVRVLAHGESLTIRPTARGAALAGDDA